LKRERRGFHRQVAEALERLFPERVKEQVGLLAYHWEQAGDAEKATEYLLQAGDQARLAYAHEEAVDFYQRALALLEETEAYDRAAQTQMKLGLTYDSAFEFNRARQAYDQGFALWQRAGQTRQGASLPPAPHALRELWEDDPDSLDPGLATSEWSLPIYQLFSGLVRRTLDTGIVPDLAASWERFQGGRRMVFYLRDDIFWSDGVPVTAHDFEFAWKRVLDRGTGSRNAPMLYDLKGARAFHEGRLSGPDSVGVQALDDLTLAVELEGPLGYLLHLLTYPATYPVPRHAVERYGDAWTDPANIVTNGPFTLESWQPGEALVLKRYPGYHGRCAGNLQRVELTMGVGDGPETLRLYEADLLEAADLPSVPSAADDWREMYAQEYVTQPNARTYGLAFNVTCPPFDDPRVRRAFAHAVDRETLANGILGGYVLPATGGFVPPGMPGHVPGIALPYDPARGRQLLAEAGYPGGEGFPDVKWLVWGDTYHAVPYLQAQWRDNLGVEIPWQSPPWGEVYDWMYGARPALFDIGWMPDYPDPDSYLRVAVLRFTAWRHEPYLTLVEQARRVMDQDKRMALYAHAEKILAEEAPLLPLKYMRMHRLVKPWLRSYPISALGAVLWEDVVMEPH
ncbi:MAG: ABC transporter substrate-binding protein, partial [Anaerolineae bacterium]